MSDFPDGALVIDPEGCGCADCIVRDSIPAELVTWDDLIAATRVIDRRGS